MLSRADIQQNPSVCFSLFSQSGSGGAGERRELQQGAGVTHGPQKHQQASAQEQCVLDRQEGNICFCRRLHSCQELEAQARGKKVLCGQRTKISFIMHA